MKTNEEWLRALRADGIEQDDALRDLREILIHGMRAYLAEDHGYNSGRGSEAKQIVEDCAQETLLIIKRKIDTFRGESRFTTWATTIAIRQLLGELRQRKWKDLSIDPSSIGRDLPKQPVEALQSDTPEMALDLIADKLGTNRDNVYKILHDARKKLKGCLTKGGITQEEILRIFEVKK